ncbi:MAG: biotin/lipoate--protein ligase family protein [Aestuariivirgaceae bacterium]
MDSGPTFPPLLNGRPVDAATGSFKGSREACGKGDAGAGDLLWSKAEDVLDVAVVLEPEVPAAQSMQMLFAAMVAFGDSFGAIGPPEVGLFYRWPNVMLINAAHVGLARAGLPDCADSDVPPWMVVGLNVRIQPGPQAPESGYDLTNTSLWDEGGGEVDRTMLVESFARHFLTWINSWTEDGFKPVHDAWMARADGRDEIVEIKWQGDKHKGRFLSLDEDGNMLLKRKAETLALPVMAIVERP